MRVLIIIAFVYCAKPFIAQQTYFIQSSPFETTDRLPQKVLTLHDNFFIGNKIFCGSENEKYACLATVKFNKSGDIIWEKIYNWTDVGNIDIIEERNDTIFMAGNELIGNNVQTINLLGVSPDGDSLFHKPIDLVDDNFIQFFLNGMHLSGSDVFFYGQTSSIPEDESICRIVKYNFNIDQVDVWDYIADEGIYFPSWDMEEDQDGNLLIYNERYNVNDIDEILEILKIDKQGNILDQINLSGPRFIRVGYNFILLENGNYCFVNAAALSSSRPKIQTSDPDGNKIWAYEFPNPIMVDFAGYYDINELHKADNGDIITVGTRRRVFELGTGTDIFLARFTSQGQLLWAKNYNTLEDEATMAYHRYFPTDVDEFEDGSLIVVGTAAHHDDIVLLRVGADGTLEGVEGNDDIAVSTDDVADDLISILYPNPTDGLINIEFQSLISGSYQCIDIAGAVLDQGSFEELNTLQLDYTHLHTGRYYLLIKEGTRSRNFGFVKE